MKKPRVSVVMPVYNGEDLLNTAIDSILGQTMRDFELVIINDGSSDQSESIILAYNDPRIRYIHQKNKGLPEALNRGVEESRARYIARMDCDDISEPSRLEKQANYLDNSSDIAMVGSSFLLIDLDGQPIGQTLCLTRPEDLEQEFKVRNPFGHGTVMVRKEALVAVGGYDPNQAIEDYDAWWRVCKRFKVANLPEILYRWRVSPAGISHGESDKRRKPIKGLMKAINAESPRYRPSIREIRNGLVYYKQLGFAGLSDQFLYMHSALALSLLPVNLAYGLFAAGKLVLATPLAVWPLYRLYYKDGFSHGYNLSLLLEDSS